MFEKDRIHTTSFLIFILNSDAKWSSEVTKQRQLFSCLRI